MESLCVIIIVSIITGIASLVVATVAIQKITDVHIENGLMRDRLQELERKVLELEYGNNQLFGLVGIHQVRINKILVGGKNESIGA